MSELNINEQCLVRIKQVRFPNGITCKRCNMITNHHKVKDRTQYVCQECGTQMSPLVGTIFERSSTPLSTWFYAMFLIQERPFIAIKELEEKLGVTYKTAWRMSHKIREADSPLV